MSTQTSTRVTITHVAKAAGVAVGTVSRVLNNFTDVNEEVRERVMAAVRKLNYNRLRRRKTASAQDSRGSRSRRGGGDSGGGGGGSGGGGGGEIMRNIAVICFGMEDALVQLPVVSMALQEIEGAIAARSGSLMFANIPRADRVPAFLEDGRVDGVIVKGPNFGKLPSEAGVPLLSRLNRMPHVWLMGRPEDATGDQCNFDIDEAGRLAARHFVSKGHIRLAFLNPNPGQNQFEHLKRSFMFHGARLGATMALLEDEPPSDTLTWPLPASTAPEKVDALIARWIAQPPARRATGIFAPSDRSAVQAYAALDVRGKRVGADVSIISCNNEESLIAGLNPRLTTIDVHAAAIGAHTVNLLLWRIANKDEPLSMQMLLQPTFVERASVAKTG
jgi:DNA-binding LacI/PurR family transcriptional regulator